MKGAAELPIIFWQSNLNETEIPTYFVSSRRSILQLFHSTTSHNPVHRTGNNNYAGLAHHHSRNWIIPGGVFGSCVAGKPATRHWKPETEAWNAARESCYRPRRRILTGLGLLKYRSILSLRRGCCCLNEFSAVYSISIFINYFSVARFFGDTYPPKSIPVSQFLLCNYVIYHMEWLGPESQSLGI